MVTSPLSGCPYQVHIMKSKTESKPAEKKQTAPTPAPARSAGDGSKNGGGGQVAPMRKNPHGIPGYRAEVPNFRTVEQWVDGKFSYTVEGDFDTPVPPIRESKYLSREQSI